jgi:hypothetical protein
MSVGQNLTTEQLYLSHNEQQQQHRTGGTATTDRGQNDNTKFLNFTPLI